MKIKTSLTKNALTCLIMTPVGAGTIFWFSWALQTTILFTGSKPPPGAGSPWVLSLTMAGVFLLVWIPLSLSSCRDRQHRWVFTKTQEARARAEDTAARTRSDAWHEANRQKDLQLRVLDSLAKLHDLDRQWGDAGIVAFMLDIPVEEVLRISGENREAP